MLIDEGTYSPLIQLVFINIALMDMRFSVLHSTDHQMVSVLHYFMFFICFSFSRRFIQFVIGC